MPFTSSWYVENRVVWMQLSGVVTPDELQAGNAGVADLIEDAPDGLILVRDGRDLRGMDLPPSQVARIASWFTVPKFAGMILFSGLDSVHLETTGEIVARLKKVPTEGAHTLSEVHQFLLELDPTLAEQLPELED